MSTIEKISVSLDSEVVVWLRRHAEQEGISLSAALNEAALLLQQASTRLAVSETLGLHVSAAELVDARAELKLGKAVKSTRKARPVERRRKQA